MGIFEINSLSTFENIISALAVCGSTAIVIISIRTFFETIRIKKDNARNYSHSRGKSGKIHYKSSPKTRVTI